MPLSFHIKVIVLDGAIPSTLTKTRGDYQMAVIQPYSDELMRYDELTNMYYLTEEALIRRGINLRARLVMTNSPSPEYVINGLLETVSELIYNYIHENSINNEYQDKIINHIEQARSIVYKALLQQAVYMLKVGNLSLSIDENVRKLAIDKSAKITLNTTITEIRRPITYTGV